MQNKRLLNYWIGVEDFKIDICLFSDPFRLQLIIEDDN